VLDLPRPLDLSSTVTRPVHVCLCGREWQPQDSRRFTAVGLRTRRLARHAGVRSRWAHPRPYDRCPSCTSRSIRRMERLLPAG
jgi:hypothetical protein